MTDIKTIATNRKAFHDYTILEKLEAGIVLTGSEIKSIRTGDVSMGDAYVRPERGELWLYNTYIARYNAASYMGHEPTRAGSRSNPPPACLRYTTGMGQPRFKSTAAIASVSSIGTSAQP